MLELLEEEIESERRLLYEDIRNLEFLGTEVTIDESKRPTHLSVVKTLVLLSEMKLMIDAITSSNFLTMKALQDFNRLSLSISL